MCQLYSVVFTIQRQLLAYASLVVVITSRAVPSGGHRIVGLAQAHPLTNPPDMRKQPSVGLGPVTAHPTHSGVGPLT